MAIFNSFTFDNENSLDSGIYITGEAVFNAPKRVVEMVNVPGRNGAIAIDEGRFENIPVKYPAGCFADNMADFAEKVENFRNILASRFTYKRLMDTYYPDEFRMGLYRSGLEVDVVNQARAGKFDIEFDCKPQRFLLSGEVPTEYIVGMSPSDEQTKTGSIVAFEAEEDTIISDVKVDINPIQSLNGYDKPWAGGNGKNKLFINASSKTENGITMTVNSDGSIKLNGTATAYTFFNLNYVDSSTLSIPVGTYYANGGIHDVVYRVYIDGSRVLDNTAIVDREFTVPSGATRGYFRIDISASSSFNNETFYPMVRLASETDASFEPYSNICPISGWDSVKVPRTGKNLLSTNYGIATRNGVTYTPQSDGSIRLDGTTNGSYYCYVKTATEAFTLPQGTYTFTCWKDGTKGTGSLSGRIRVDIGSTAGTTYYMSNGVVTIDIPSDAILWVFLQAESGKNATGTYRILVERSSTSSDEWEPYQGNTYTIDLKGTRYGAHIDVTSGVMTVDRKIVGSSEIKSYYTSWDANIHRYQAQFTGSFNGKANSNTSVNNPTNALCNIMDISASWNDMQSFDGTEVEAGMYHYPQWDYTRLYIILPTSVTTKTDAETWLDNSSIQVVYELATPITVQLTPTEVKTLLGTNNIWADSGDITVKYGTDPYIIINPTDFPSKPLLEVTGVGSFWLGDTQITITGTSGQIIYIDCETGECYKEAGGIISSANGLVTLNRLDFPKLASGINNIQLGSGISTVKITPRWWRL